jgi:hypothetical protein
MKKLFNKQMLASTPLASTPLSVRIFNTYDSFVIVFNDQDSLEKAIDIMQSADQEILDIQSPHYIEIEKLKESKKPINYGIIAGISGVTGFILISLLILYVMGKPQLLIGNKGLSPIMAYVPVLFTVSILFSALGLLFAFCIKNHLLPGQQNQVSDKLASSENYIMIILKKLSQNELENMLKDIEYINIFEHPFIEQNINLPFPLKMK